MEMKDIVLNNSLSSKTFKFEVSLQSNLQELSYL